MLFCKFLVAAVVMAILFLYCFSNCDFVGTWQHFLMFLGFKNLFCGFFTFQTPWQHFIFFLDLYINMSTLFFCFLDPYINIFVDSLHSIPQHGLEMLSFVLAIHGNSCCHGNTFSVSSTYGIYKYFCGFFFAFQAPAQIGAD